MMGSVGAVLFMLCMLAIYTMGVILVYRYLEQKWYEETLRREEAARNKFRVFTMEPEEPEPVE